MAEPLDLNENEDVMRYLKNRFPSCRVALFIFRFDDAETETYEQSAISNFCCLDHTTAFVVDCLNYLIDNQGVKTDHDLGGMLQ